ncbi:MAG: hypothetical protein J5966_05775 [Lachnospiraceae bacterium]|nr:hypothetical protein [Lachnospiraceae bacterium]
MGKIYNIPFAYEKYGRIEVTADSVEEAVSIAEEMLSRMSVSEMEELAEYLADSEEIDHEGVITDASGNPVDEDETGTVQAEEPGEWINTDDMQRCRFLEGRTYQLIEANSVDDGYLISDDMVVDMTPGGLWIDSDGNMTAEMQGIFNVYYPNPEDFKYEDSKDREQILAELVYEQTSSLRNEEGYGLMDEDTAEMVLDHFTRFGEYPDLMKKAEIVMATYKGASIELYRNDFKYWSNSAGELHQNGERDITEDELPEELKAVYRDYWEECPNGLHCYLAEYTGSYGLALIAEYHEKTPEGKEGELNNKKHAYRVRNKLSKLPYLKGALIIAEECGFPGYDMEDLATELVLFIPAKDLNKQDLDRIEEVFGDIAYL